MTRPVLRVELGANTSCTVSSPLKSLATTRALIPSFLWSRSQRVVTLFLPRAVCMSTISYTQKFCESFKFLQLGLRRLLSLRVVDKRVQEFSSVLSARSSSSVPDVVTPASAYSERPSASFHLADALLVEARPVSWVRLLAWSVWTT